MQKDLSLRQAKWMELMSQYDAKIMYIKGNKNTVADALSQLPCDDTLENAEWTAQHPYDYCEDKHPHVTCIWPAKSHTPWEAVMSLADGPDLCSVNTTLSISADKQLLQQIKDGYAQDPWCRKLHAATPSWPGLQLKDSLWYMGDRLIIPCTGSPCELLFQLAHDTLGHFGFDKTYGSPCSAYYWPNMCCDLEKGYVVSCPECQQNKLSTSKPIGPLHPLPIPDQCRDSVVGSDIQLAATQTDINTEELAYIFFDKWYCENGLPSDIFSDRDKVFISKFWKALHKLTGIKLKLSTAYHPQMDSASEWTNKSINQCLCYHVEQNQHGWSHALPCICFHIMNTVNTSTGFTPFQLWMGQSPCLIPPLLILPWSSPPEIISAHEVICRLQSDVAEAQDNLLHAKISQSVEANKHHSPTFPFTIGSHVQLTTLHQHNEYKTRGDKRVAKFMPCYNGPYTIVNMDEHHSTITIELLDVPNVFPMFHTSKVLPYIENDPALFPSCKFKEPPAILNP